MASTERTPEVKTARKYQDSDTTAPRSENGIALMRKAQRQYEKEKAESDKRVAARARKARRTRPTLVEQIAHELGSGLPGVRKANADPKAKEVIWKNFNKEIATLRSSHREWKETTNYFADVLDALEGEMEGNASSFPELGTMRRCCQIVVERCQSRSEYARTALRGVELAQQEWHSRMTVKAARGRTPVRKTIARKVTKKSPAKKVARKVSR